MLFPPKAMKTSIRPKYVLSFCPLNFQSIGYHTAFEHFCEFVQTFSLKYKNNPIYELSNENIFLVTQNYTSADSVFFVDLDIFSIERIR